MLKLSKLFFLLSFLILPACASGIHQGKSSFDGLNFVEARPAGSTKSVKLKLYRDEKTPRGKVVVTVYVNTNRIIANNNSLEFKIKDSQELMQFSSEQNTDHSSSTTIEHSATPGISDVVTLSTASKDFIVDISALEKIGNSTTGALVRVKLDKGVIQDNLYFDKDTFKDFAEAARKI